MLEICGKFMVGGVCEGQQKRRKKKWELDCILDHDSCQNNDFLRKFMGIFSLLGFWLLRRGVGGW